MSFKLAFEWRSGPRSKPFRSLTNSKYPIFQTCGVISNDYLLSPSCSTKTVHRAISLQNLQRLLNLKLYVPIESFPNCEPCFTQLFHLLVRMQAARKDDLVYLLESSVWCNANTRVQRPSHILQTTIYYNIAVHTAQKSQPSHCKT